MKKEEKKPFIQCCILGAIGGILMAAGDWLLGCVPLQKTDTGMFNRACYLSGAYALWKPALVVGMGALGCFLYSFMVKALNTDIDARYSRTKAIQYFCGLFTVVVGIAISTGAAIAREIADITVFLGRPFCTGNAAQARSGTDGAYPRQLSVHCGLQPDTDRTGRGGCTAAHHLGAAAQWVYIGYQSAEYDRPAGR